MLNAVLQRNQVATVERAMSRTIAARRTQRRDGLAR
jgi:hypothetical protein